MGEVFYFVSSFGGIVSIMKDNIKEDCSMEERKKGIVILSGGMDSSTVLAYAKSMGYVLYALTFDYGQRHKIELAAAKSVAESVGVRKHVIVSFDLKEIGGSALIDKDVEVPKDLETYENFRRNSAPVTYVPARNTVFLSFALGWAEVIGARDIFIGIAGDSVYPDCKKEYLDAFEVLARVATKVGREQGVEFKIHAPFLGVSKGEIIRIGKRLGLDYGLTWSCYDPQEKENGYFYPCLKCDSCITRKMGFKEAGVEDPLRYYKI